MNALKLVFQSLKLPRQNLRDITSDNQIFSSPALSEAQAKVDL